MRKLILIATMSLLATQAYAGGSRGLSLAASQVTEQPATTAPPQATQAPTATPPANVKTATTAPASPQPVTSPQTATAPAATATQPVAETAKPKHREPSAEARVIRELHRHGIYW
ncbi:hypothetical protein [Bradyrhizobium sp. BR13661]|jgi:hypothetical protein|uniref:hypothetical protein n=1 Tax=Bradyrhizobium sp. BR13661 TaxID=2940622 RepID=UPI002473DE72|nr:hypothetical protein [Bradyrhizobium sp. BR13661]MDH6256908.1 putative component of type VI protein secretion system [Bradyrhizobium sp. BR13661]